MNIRRIRISFFFIVFIFFSHFTNPALSQETDAIKSLDVKVKRFLENHRGKWVDWNVPEDDGEVLYDLIIKNGYTKALEIGTSTGHSAIWIAWALSKTGGKLTTIEINEARYKKALKNFQEAGLLKQIDARLADAHDLVKELKGPFDFVFFDADKDWYKKYFMLLEPKLEVGGCITAHNVLWDYDRGIREFMNHVKSLPNFKTTINRATRQGISISYKRAKN